MKRWRVSGSLLQRRRRQRRRHRCSSSGLLVFVVVSCYYGIHNAVRNLVVHCEQAPYPIGCSKMYPSYYDDDHIPFPPPYLIPQQLRTMEDYWLVRRLGVGRFSDVYEAVDVVLAACEEEESPILQPTTTTTTSHDDDETVVVVDPRSLVVIKCLKPISMQKVRREILMLSHASHLPNLVRLLAVVIPPNNNITNNCSDDDSNNNNNLPQQPSPTTSSNNNNNNMPWLVLKHAGPWSQWLCHGRFHHTASQGSNYHYYHPSYNDDRHYYDEDYYLSEYEIKYYMLHLLIAIDSLHSISIMHRDIKPRNVMINRHFTLYDNTHYNYYMVPTPQASHHHHGDDSPLMLIDMGLADFYMPHTRYNVRVASRHYKSPELLVGYEFYHYAIDMWGFGCILAGLLLRHEPIFRGNDNMDQLAKIVSVLGTRDLVRFMKRYQVDMTPSIQNVINQCAKKEKRQRKKRGSSSRRRPKRNWISFMPPGSPMPSRAGLHLLDRLLVYDPDRRWTARQAMKHSFFDQVRHRVMMDIVRDKTVELHNNNPG